MVDDDTPNEPVPARSPGQHERLPVDRAPAAGQEPLDAHAVQLARILWSYLQVGHTLQTSDIIAVLGSSDLRCAEWGAKLWLDGWAPLLVMSGGRGRLTAHWERTEAEAFGAVAEKLGVPRERIILEDRSGNTGENVRFTRRLVERAGLSPRRCIAVHTPHMERRSLATFLHFWPELQVRVTSPPISLERYPTRGVSLARMVHRLAGEVHRMLEYPPRGYQAALEVPDAVLAAWRELVALGYDDDLVPGGTVPPLLQAGAGPSEVGAPSGQAP